ncbi:MAG: hypothetical protein ACYTGL_22100 [Planctomycetota bacterium]|jgi:hypothetical protein
MKATDSLESDVPLAAKSPHWNYGCAARFGFTWDERVAMSELMIGPEHVQQSDDGRVVSVDLRGRTISTERLSHLRDLPFIERLDLSNSSVTKAVIPILLGLPHLNCVHLIGSPVNLWGILRLKLGRRHLQVDGSTDPSIVILGFMFLGLALLVISLIIRSLMF